MDTTNKHIGNQLSQMSDKDIKEVFEQYAHKLELDKFDSGKNWEVSVLHKLNDILMCNHFDNNGNALLIDEDITSDKYCDKLND